MCLTETKLQLSDDTTQIKAKLQEHLVIKRNCDANKYKSAICYATRVQVLGLEHFDSLSVYILKK